MAVKENIHIHEKVTVFIKDTNGKVTERVIKTPWHEKSLKDKILTLLGLKREPGTLNDDGIYALAELYGGYDIPGATYGPVAYLVSYNSVGPTWYHRTITRSWAKPTLTISNIDSPFDASGTYTNIHLSDRVMPNGTFLYHTIQLAGANEVKIASGFAWWVEVKLSFSGS